MTAPNRFVAEPAAWLKPFVHSYWGIARDLSQVGGFTVTPDRFPELICFANPPMAKDKTGRRRLPACAFIGLLSHPLHLEMRGMVRCASIRLYAWSGGMVLREAEQHPDREWYAGPRALAVRLPRVRDALKRGAWTEIPPLFDEALAEAFSSPPSGAGIEAARAFSERTGEASPGTERVAERLDYSRRQVERQVRAVTGISPKQLSSLVRFQFVRDALWAEPLSELASLAIDAGYADQAHMTREFKKYAGQTPLAFRRHCSRLKRVLNAQNVAFVQDRDQKKDQGSQHDD